MMDPLAAHPTTATTVPTTATAPPTTVTDVPAITPVDGSTPWGVSAAGVQALTTPGTAVTAAPVPTTDIAYSAGADLSLAQALAEQLAAQNIVPTTSTMAAAVGSLPMVVGETTAGALAGFASATGRAANAVATVAGAGISKAKHVGSELWAGIRNPKSVHVTQVPSKFNPKPAAGNRDCGPTSVVIALGMIGKSVPGAGAKSSAQAKIDRVRELAGSPDNSQSTSNIELAKALEAAGAKTREVTDLASIKDAITAGSPVILNGNPRASGAYGTRFTAAQMTPFDGAHWITVTGFDSDSGKYIINDPLSKAGPVKVSAKELEAYRGGSLGIVVSD